MSLQGARDDPGYLVGIGIFAHSPIISLLFSFPNLYLSALSRGPFNLDGFQLYALFSVSFFQAPPKQ